MGKVGSLKYTCYNTPHSGARGLSLLDSDLIQGLKDRHNNRLHILRASYVLNGFILQLTHLTLSTTL